MSNFQEWSHDLDERAAQSVAQIRDLVESAAPGAIQVGPVTIASDTAFIPLRDCYDWFFCAMQRVSMELYAYRHSECCTSTNPDITSPTCSGGCRSPRLYWWLNWPNCRMISRRSPAHTRDSRTSSLMGLWLHRI
jgi:hypothetical protein